MGRTGDKKGTRPAEASARLRVLLPAGSHPWPEDVTHHPNPGTFQVE